MLMVISATHVPQCALVNHFYSPYSVLPILIARTMPAFNRSVDAIGGRLNQAAYSPTPARPLHSAGDSLRFGQAASPTGRSSHRRLSCGPSRKEQASRRGIHAQQGFWRFTQQADDSVIHEMFQI
ncbi:MULTISPECIES: hypothetical protein [Burkholderia]|uniref:hypothetical protein n=1 Tax=Burkholderia TaxID=32008 RepID=UPI000F5DFC88|nr:MULTISPECIES: hypothetical protein [Burkholderia]MBY4866415.1 hypothetical protein [Burkholderia anthina]